MRQKYEEFEGTIKKMYSEGYGVEEIAQKLGKFPSNISRYLNRIFGEDRPKRKRVIYTKRKYSLNDSFFSTIDTQEKAYILGLIYADGCINDINHCFQICLIAHDSYLLDKIKSIIGCEKPLVVYKEKEREIGGKKFISKEQKMLAICSVRIKEDLIKLGVSPRKSLTLTFPTEEQVPKEFQSHFIRGYFDGDGSLPGEGHRVGLSIAGTLSFCKDVKKVIAYATDVEGSVAKHPSLNCYYFISRGKLNVIDICKYLYKDSKICMERKYKKYQEILSLSKNERYGNSWRKIKKT